MGGSRFPNYGSSSWKNDQCFMQSASTAHSVRVSYLKRREKEEKEEGEEEEQEEEEGEGEPCTRSGQDRH